MRCEPANSTITKLGGITKVSRACKVSASTVLRWREPKEKGGTGGVIPPNNHPRLFELASEVGVQIGADDLVSVPQPSNRGAAA